MNPAIHRTSFAALVTILVAFLAAPGGVDAAAPTSQAPDGSGMTIYSQGQALVRLRVDRSLSAGTAEIDLDGLPTSVDPGSIIVLNPEVTLIQVDGMRTYQDAVRGSGASVRLRMAVSAPVPSVEIAYLTGGLSWQASYSLIVAADDSAANMDGYATLHNGSGASFAAQQIQLLAGDVAVATERRQYRALASVAQAGSYDGGEFDEEAFGGYHLYTLNEPLALAHGVAQRTRMNGGRDIPVQRVLRVVGDVHFYDDEIEPERIPAQIRFRVARDAATDFGATPLPAGAVRVFQRDGAGRVQLLGADSIEHTPASRDLDLAVGTAFDVVAERTQVSTERLGPNRFESEWRIIVRNAEERDRRVAVYERFHGSWEIVQSSHPIERAAVATGLVELDVPAGGEVELSYRVRINTDRRR